MTDGIFTCPVCKELLFIEGNSLKCSKRHSFDISRRGYVNLLLSGDSSNHGDDRNMVTSRRDFLNLGHYHPLADKVAGKCLNFACSGARILDIGCGEGYYTSIIKEKLESCGKDATVLGIDISKTALDYACRRNKDISYAVSSAFSLPLPEESVDIAVNVFAPHDTEEISRVLKDEGILIMVLPQKRHLWELKQLIYSNPYENESPVPSFEHFSLIEDERLTYTAKLRENKNILNLFSMTPYLYNTSQEDAEKLNGIDSIDLTLDFRIAVFRKDKTKEKSI